ncbi:MAG: alpha/beta hydrolase [Acidobacteriota bacterium]
MTFDALAAGPEDGEPVLLLHGFPQTSYSFRTELLALGEAGYHAVAVDQRGYSPDARPSEPGAYAMGELVGDVVAIADALGAPRFHLVGHDWGGAVAWVVATRFPQRVRTLTVLSTPHFLALGRSVATQGSEQAQRSSYFTDFAAPDAAERFLEDDMALFRELMANAPIAAADLEVYRERLSSLAAMRAALNWYRTSAPRPAPAGSAATGGGSPAPPPTTPNIPPIGVPTLYLWGTEDGAFARATAEATAEFVTGPYAFHALEGVGHWIPEQASDTVIRLLLEHFDGDDLTRSPLRGNV